MIMNVFERYLITAALPYANGPLHIGHLAGAYLSSDIFARFMRLMDKDVAFICGSDENGAAITMRAIKEDRTPKDIVDEYHQLFKDTFEKIGVSFDHYHRTSDPLHHETSQDFFRTLYKKGVFLEKETEQYFDSDANQFLADRYIKGTCPKCSYEEAYGDQCENCGSDLSPEELINPLSTLTGSKPALKKTKHWYLPLDKDENWLKEWITEGTLDGKEHHIAKAWKNHVIGQCKSWLDNGLQPRAMTRDLDWGVDVPQEIDGADGKKLYVWMDAPIGYISSTKQWAKENNKDWKDYWQSDNSALVHFIGKDNIVFHCIIFPSILKAHGDYNLPINVPANQFMNLEGNKISTSRNWAIWVHEYLNDLPGKEDELRYTMIKTMPELKDSEFTWKGYQDANNNELVNNLANFVNRVIVLTHKYYDGKVPSFDEDIAITGHDGQDGGSYHDNEMLSLHDDLDQIRENIQAYDFRAGIKQLMEISSKGNQILQFNEPWKAIKTDPEQTAVVINLCLQYVSAIRTAVDAFLPFTSKKISHLLNIPEVESQGGWNDMMMTLALGEMLLPADHKVNESNHIFSRISDEEIQVQIDKLMASQTPTDDDNSAFEAVKEEITFDDFVKMDIRTGTIIEAEKVPKTSKLLKLIVDLGFETRTVVSGIAKAYDPEKIVGKKVSLLANLAPRKIKGIESKGMILMASGEEDGLSFVSPEDGWKNGKTIS